MVKADLSRDYYADLEISPTADVAEIKKQFKKLALKYHPDRNPGTENEVIAKFQSIQSAHEVLIDPLERSKYDSNRTRFSSTSFRNSYTTGTATGTRGNPWSNVSSQFPTPPKHPTARKPPPPSTGARRYEKFATPNQSAYQAQQEGAEGRYAAWENLRHQNQNTKEYGPGKTWRAPQPPPRGTPKSGREESNAQKHPPPPKARPGYEEFREANSSHGRSQSTNAPNRKGFMPNTPLGGDEPPAPMGAYFTQRNKPDTPPVPPPREHIPQREPVPDPLRPFREKMTPSMDARQSQPYATHGGEKFNLFETANMARSKSTRVPAEKNYVPRTGSDSNLNSPHRAKSSSFAEQTNARQSRPAHAEPIIIDDSSSDDLPQMKSFGSRASAKRNNGTIPKETVQPTPMNSEPTSKQSQFQRFREWMRENPGQEPPLNGFPPGGPPPRSGQAEPGSDEEPSMYARPNFTSVKSDPSQKFGYKPSIPTVSESATPARDFPSKQTPYGFASVKYSTLFSGCSPVTPPSGTTGPTKLNAFEENQRSLVNDLINKRSISSGLTPEVSSAGVPRFRHPTKLNGVTDNDPNDPFSTETPNFKSGSPSGKKRKPSSQIHAEHSFASSNKSRLGSSHETFKTSANHSHPSFSFDVNQETFNRTQYKARFSNSAENMKFTPEDWDGKFEAGGDYFKPEQKAAGVPGARAQSGTRVRGRSPAKGRPTVDPRFMQPRVDPETPMESPNEAKFSPEEWAETFKPQTFMPVNPGIPPRPMSGRKRTNPTIRPTMGSHAAMVDDSSTSEEKPLFNGQSKAPEVKTPPQTVTPEPMDIDMTPPARTVPQFMSSMAGKGLNINTEPLKRPAAPSSTTSPIEEAALKVELEDLKLADLISTISIPIAPKAPALPSYPVGQSPSPAAFDDYIKRFASYMKDWDLYNSKFILHLVARKNVNTTLGDRRWTEKTGIEQYRKGLQQDEVVLSQWKVAQIAHEGAVKSMVVLKEVMSHGAESASGNGGLRDDRPSPRKKAH